MNLKEIPVVIAKQTRYQFSVLLDGVRYYVEIYYNKRVDTWMMNLKDATQAAIVYGIPLLTNVINPITRFKFDGVLQFGDFTVLDALGIGADATFFNFGEDVSLFYLSINDG
jgi:hypothetical protein